MAQMLEDDCFSLAPSHLPFTACRDLAHDSYGFVLLLALCASMQDNVPCVRANLNCNLPTSVSLCRTPQMKVHDL